MSKKAKIIILLLFIFLALSVYLLLSTKEVTVRTKAPQSSEEFARQVEEKQKKMEDTYEYELKRIFSDYDVLVSSNSSEIGLEILKLRDKIKVLTVPAQYLEMNMDLFLAFSEAERINPEEMSVITSEISKLINEARSAYSWLNE